MKLTPRITRKPNDIEGVQSDVTQPQTEENTAILRTPGPQAGDSSAEGGSQSETDREAAETEEYDDDDGYTERLDAVDARIDTLDARVDSIDSRVSIAMSIHGDAPDDDLDSGESDTEPDNDIDTDRLDYLEQLLDSKVNDAELAELVSRVDDMSAGVDTFVDMVSGRFDEAKARNDKRMTGIENQVLDDSRLLDDVCGRLDKLQGIVDVLAAPAPEPEPDPDSVEPETPPEPAKLVCPKCGSPDGWLLDSTFTPVPQWFCRRCGKPVDIPSPVKAKGGK